jgi:hypothetical protein
MGRRRPRSLKKQRHLKFLDVLGHQRLHLYRRWQNITIQEKKSVLLVKNGSSEYKTVIPQETEILNSQSNVNVDIPSTT